MFLEGGHLGGGDVTELESCRTTFAQHGHDDGGDGDDEDYGGDDDVGDDDVGDVTELESRRTTFAQYAECCQRSL